MDRQVILSKERDLRLVTVRRGGTLQDSDHHLLAIWAADCAQHTQSELPRGSARKRARRSRACGVPVATRTAAGRDPRNRVGR